MERRLIAGRYELLEQIGGSSWRATDTELRREVLVRLPARELSTATLSHPSIARLFDQGEENGTPYAVFEYLPGGSLEQRLALGPLPQSEAREVAIDVAAALTYAHEQGVTHGSVDPANVLLDGEGRAKLAGFRGDATPEEDLAALGGLIQLLGVAAPGAPQSEVTAILEAVPSASRHRPLALVAVALLVLLAAGVGAAFLAASGGESAKHPAGSLSLPVSTRTTEPTTRAAPPATTAETTTEDTTTAPTTTAVPTTTAAVTTTVAPTTTSPPTTSAPPPPATTEPPPTTEPPVTTAPPVTTEPPPTTEPAPPTTEPPPVTTAAITTG